MHGHCGQSGQPRIPIRKLFTSLRFLEDGPKYKARSINPGMRVHAYVKTNTQRTWHNQIPDMLVLARRPTYPRVLRYTREITGRDMYRRDFDAKMEISTCHRTPQQIYQVSVKCLSEADISHDMPLATVRFGATLPLQAICPRISHGMPSAIMQVDLVT